MNINAQVTQKKLADPHIDVTFNNNLTIRFTTGYQAAFAQGLKMGEWINIAFTREEEE